MGFATDCIHAGQEPDPSTGAIITPIYQTSTYVQEGLGQHKGYEYARTQNPTRRALEKNLAALEGGTDAYCYASGMAAIQAVLSLVEAGQRVVVSDNVYGGTHRLFTKVLRFYQNAAGGILSPFDSWLVLRGTKTLALRMPRHEENGRKVAEFLRAQKKVHKVYWPGFPDHPGHDLQRRQASGFGSMITF